MTFGHQWHVLLCQLWICACAMPLVATADESFDVRLSPAPRDAAMRKTIAGTGTARVTLTGAQLTITGTFAGFPAPATRAQLHQGPVVGARGPAIYELTVVNATSGEFEGSLTLNADALAGLNAGHLYLQLASESAPDGNVWGWLLPAGANVVRDR